MHVLGVDYSTSAVDMALLSEDDRVEWLRLDIGPPRKPTLAVGMRGLLAARDAARDLPGPASSEWDDVAMVAIENPWSVNAGTAKALGLVGGAIVAQVPSRVTVLLVSPLDVDRAIGIPIRLKREKRKPAMRARVIELLEIEAVDWPQDAFDAVAVAYTARVLCARGEVAA